MRGSERAREKCEGVRNLNEEYECEGEVGVRSVNEGTSERAVNEGVNEGTSRGE